MKNLKIDDSRTVFIFILLLIRMSSFVAISAQAEEAHLTDDIPLMPSPSPASTDAGNASVVVIPEASPTPDDHLTAIPFAPASPVLPEPPQVSEVVQSSSQNQFDWGAFQVGIPLSNQGGGTSASLLARYQPELKFHPAQREDFFGTGFDLAFTSFKNNNGTRFLAIEYDLYGAFHFNPKWEVRLFAGFQSWAAGNGTYFDLGPAVLYHFAETARLLDGVYFSYRSVSKSPRVNIFEIGINLNFN